jgi:hypothetical protein
MTVIPDSPPPFSNHHSRSSPNRRPTVAQPSCSPFQPILTPADGLGRDRTAHRADIGVERRCDGRTNILDRLGHHSPIMRHHRHQPSCSPSQGPRRQRSRVRCREHRPDSGAQRRLDGRRDGVGDGWRDSWKRSTLENGWDGGHLQLFDRYRDLNELPSVLLYDKRLEWCRCDGFPRADPD